MAVYDDRKPSFDGSPQAISLALKPKPLFLLVAALLLALQLFSVWHYRFFPSQDGPSHVANAVIMAGYGANPEYREYYQVRWFNPAGNLFSDWLLAGLCHITSPAIAQKLLLSIYFLMVPGSLLYLLRAVAPQSQHLALFGMALSPGMFIHLGFWNFSFSVALCLFALGLYARTSRRWTPFGVLSLAAAATVVYFAHVLSWTLLALSVAFWALLDCRANWLKCLRNSLVLVFVFVPGAVLWLTHSLSAQDTAACTSQLSLRDRAWLLYSASFLRSVSASDTALSRVFALFVVFLAFAALYQAFRGKQRTLLPSALWVTLSATAALLTAVAPSCIGAGGYIPERLALYAWIFLLVALATTHWSIFWQRLITTALVLFLGVGALSRLPSYASWNRTLAEIDTVAPAVKQGSTVLPLVFHDTPAGPNPSFHAVGLLYARGVINLDNYEASTPYFPVEFRAPKSPFPSLGTRAELETDPAFFDIDRFERKTSGRVDYILFTGRPDDRPEQKLYAKALQRFQLIEVSRPTGRFRLYQRK